MKIIKAESILSGKDGYIHEQCRRKKKKWFHEMFMMAQKLGLFNNYDCES